MDKYAINIANTNSPVAKERYRDSVGLSILV